MLRHPNKADRKYVEAVNKRWTGIKETHLRRCALRAREKTLPGVAVLAVGAVRAEIVLQCLKLGLINHLILDTDCGQRLCSLLLGQKSRQTHYLYPVFRVYAKTGLIGYSENKPGRSGSQVYNLPLELWHFSTGIYRLTPRYAKNWYDYASVGRSPWSLRRWSVVPVVRRRTD